MSTSVPSQMTRRRKAPGKRVFNAATVLADFVPASYTPSSYYRDNFTGGSRNPCTLVPAGRIQAPERKHVHFLYENPRFINEPICFANTKATKKMQSDWWGESEQPEKKHVPKYNTGTVSRSDYVTINEPPRRATRFGMKPDRDWSCAKGLAPNVANDSGAVDSMERISYEHGFDCRTGRKERGKLHGSFVCSSTPARQIPLLPLYLHKRKQRLRNKSQILFDEQVG